MQRHISIILSFALFAFFFVACGGGEEKSDEKGFFDKLGETAENVEKATKGIQETAKEMENMANREPVPPVHFNKLIEYLPTDAFGMTMEEPKGETVTSGEWTYSTASVKFRSEDGQQRAEVTISDFAYIPYLYIPYKTMMNMKFSKESTSGYERSAEIMGFPGFESWKKKSLREEITLIVGERFLVVIKTVGLAMGQAKVLLESMGLIRLSEERAEEPAS